MKTTMRVTALFVLAGLPGCSTLGGGLRRDLDDMQFEEGPVTGGRFSERGMLGGSFGEESQESENEWTPPAGAIGHVDRSIASTSRLEDLGERDLNDSKFSSRDGDRPPEVRRNYRNGARATRADFVDDANQNESSLWASDGQTNYYFTKNKIRGVGDLVNVTIEEPLIKDIGREILRNLSPHEREYELGQAQERIRRKALGLPEEADLGGAAGKDEKSAQNAAAPERGAAVADGQAPKAAADEKIPEATPADVNVLKSLDIKSGEVIMAEIVERYPNGNYRVRAVKRVPYRGGRQRLLSFLAIAKGSDISEDDTIQSGKLYEYRVEEVLE